MAKERRDLTPMELAKLRWLEEAKGKGGRHEDDPAFAESYPNLWEMFIWQGDADMRKDAPTLAVSRDGTCWKVTLRDNALKRSLTVVDALLVDALKRLSELIPDMKAPWVSMGGKRRGWKEVK